MWGPPPPASASSPRLHHSQTQSAPVAQAAELRSADSRGRLSPHKTLLYHDSVHSLAERVLSHIRRQELLQAGDRVGVAVSGGIDSVALLRVLLELRGELGIVLFVVHFNHRLRGAESDGDQEFVAGLAREYDLEFYCDSDDVAGHAAEEHLSVETAARELRYGFFRYLLGTEGNRSGAEAQADKGVDDRSAEGSAPPKGGPQGLKPASLVALNGTAEAVPFHEPPCFARPCKVSSDEPRFVST